MFHLIYWSIIVIVFIYCQAPFNTMHSSHISEKESLINFVVNSYANQVF